MSDPTLTSPREMQAKRVAAAMDAERAFRLEEGEEVTFDVGQHPGGNLPGGLTVQQVDISERAINLFIAAVCATRPRTGLSVLSPDELREFRKQAVRGLGDDVGPVVLPF